jgi:hypothetical protein
LPQKIPVLTDKRPYELPVTTAFFDQLCYFKTDIRTRVEKHPVETDFHAFSLFPDREHARGIIGNYQTQGNACQLPEPVPERKFVMRKRQV